MDIKTALSRIVGHLDLSTAEMSDVMREIMTGQCTDAQIGAFMMAMRMKSESIDEIVGAVSVMRELADKVELKTLDGVVDVVGTGGDGANIFNVSTASSLSSQRRAAPWPSMVTVRSPARAAVPTCWKRRASI